MKIAIAILIKNGEDWRLRNVLKSLKNQDRKADEIILVDGGSTYINYLKYLKVIENLQLKVIRASSACKLFHPARMLNKALSVTSCDYLIATDIDIVMSKNALEEAEKEFELGNFVMCSRLDLDETSNKPTIDFKIDDWWADKKLRKGHGSFQGVSTRWIRSIGGYCDEFRGWGFYDMYLEWVAKKKGKKWTMLDKKGVKLLHVYHDPLPYRDQTSKKNQNLYYKKTRNK
jgi:glycosyltransferase involved in cell wall biosynthesis